MLHKGYSETDLERMFGVYGELKEVRKEPLPTRLSVFSTSELDCIAVNVV
jgi:hypothetical protein